MTNPHPAGADDWTEPGIYEVAPGVHRVPLPLPQDGLRAVNVYVVVDGDELVLIDSGWAIPVAREMLGSALSRLGATFGDVRRFFVTHIHRDHYSQAIAIRREFGGRIGLGEGERAALEVIREPERAPLSPQFETLRVCGAGDLVDRILAQRTEHHSDHSQWELPDDWLTDGQILRLNDGRSLQVIETPGHTRGHVVFRDEASSLLFAGDHVLPSITPSIGFEPVLSQDPLGDFLGSLAVVRSLPDTVLLPAHGQVRPSVHARVDELLDHHGRRLDDTEAAVIAGARTAYDVARFLPWTRRERRLDELDEFNQMLAIAETGAHLTLLVAQGRLSCKEDHEGVKLYEP